MVSAKDNQDIDNLLNDLMKPQPINVKAPPECYQDGKTYRKTRFDCLDCDFFESCKV